MNIAYNLLQGDQLPFLKEMLYEALFVPPGQVPFPISILEEPSIIKYISDWGSKDKDLAIVATHQSEPVGAIWGRLFLSDNPGYGYINDSTPEISMAVKSEFRNQGIGMALLEQIVNEYAQTSIAQLSLSVDKRNPAVHLYERNGFVLYKDVGTAITMIKSIEQI